jgi:hypothetical protein
VRRTSSQLLKTVTVVGDWNFAKVAMKIIGPLPNFEVFASTGRWLWKR